MHTICKTSVRRASPLAACATLAVLGLAAARPAPAQSIVAPNAPANATAYEGTAPFNNPSRFQTLYAASQFSALTGPKYVTQIAFRPGPGQAAFTHSFTNIQFDLSTTHQTVSGLSTTFASNVGANDTVVFSGPLSVSSAGTASGQSFGAFDILVNLATPFLYDPNAGNLLLDIRNSSTGFAGYVDADYDPSANAPVSQVFVDNSTTAATGTVQTAGLIARFTFAATPEPSQSAAFGVGLIGLGALALKARRRKASDA